MKDLIIQNKTIIYCNITTPISFVECDVIWEIFDVKLNVMR